MTANKSDLPEDVAPTESLDLYEAKYMTDKEPALFRSKARSSWQAPAFTVALSLYFIIWCAAHGQWPLGLALAAGTMITGLYFAVMRVKVSRTSVEIRYGSLGPTIPLAAIESAEPVVHAHRGLLRWGVTVNRKGERLYVVAGDAGNAVRIAWRTPRGRRRVHVIGSREPQQFAAAIQRARSGILPPARETEQ